MPRRRLASSPSTPTSLPSGEDWSPPWCVRDDTLLSDALCFISRHTLSLQRLADSPSERAEHLSSIKAYLRAQHAARRRSRDICRRLQVLEHCFGPDEHGFDQFRLLCRKVPLEEASAHKDAPQRTQQGERPTRSSEGRLRTQAKPPDEASSAQPSTGPGRRPPRPALAAACSREPARVSQRHLEFINLVDDSEGDEDSETEREEPHPADQRLLQPGYSPSGASSGAKDPARGTSLAQDVRHRDQRRPSNAKDSDAPSQKKRHGQAVGMTCETAPRRSGGSSGTCETCTTPGCLLPNRHMGVCESEILSGPRNRKATQRLGVGDGFLSSPASTWGSANAPAPLAGPPKSDSDSSCAPANPVDVPLRCVSSSLRSPEAAPSSAAGEPSATQTIRSRLRTAGPASDTPPYLGGKRPRGVADEETIPATAIADPGRANPAVVAKGEAAALARGAPGIDRRASKRLASATPSSAVPSSAAAEPPATQTLRSRLRTADPASDTPPYLGGKRSRGVADETIPATAIADPGRAIPAVVVAKGDAAALARGAPGIDRRASKRVASATPSSAASSSALSRGAAPAASVPKPPTPFSPSCSTEEPPASEPQQLPSSMEVDEAEMLSEMRAAAAAAFGASPLSSQGACDSWSPPHLRGPGAADTKNKPPDATRRSSGSGRAELYRQADGGGSAGITIRDAHGFPLPADAIGQLVDTTRRNIYGRLLLSVAETLTDVSTPACADGSLAHTDMYAHLHPEARVELRAQLMRTAMGVENSTLLLVGPRGAGKHRLLATTLHQMRCAAHSRALDTAVRGAGRAPHLPTPDALTAAADFLVVDLTTLLLADEVTTLMAIAAQLGVAAQIQMKRFGSFADGLRHVLHLLRRSNPGSYGEGRREAQAQPVCFILHDFDSFALRHKQTFLYSLFDLCQTDDAQMCVVGLTSRIDALDLLEKRVRSRFSGRQLFLNYLPNASDAALLVRNALADVVPADGRLDEDQGLRGSTGRDVFDSETTIDSVAWSRFSQVWAERVSDVIDTLTTSTTFERLLWQGLTPRTLIAGVKLHVSGLTAARPLPTAAGIEEALTRGLALPVPEEMLPELSVVELLLLLSLKRRMDSEAPPPHTLRSIVREYNQFLAAEPEAAAQYGLPLATLTKAFEHLISLGLVRTEGAPTGAGGRAAVTAALTGAAGGGGSVGLGALSLDATAVRLLLAPRTLEVFVQSSKTVPTVVAHFGGSRWAC